MDESLRQATLGASNIQTPGSPLGSFPELSQLYQSSFQLPQSSGAVSALGNQAGEIVRQQEAAKSAAKARKTNYQKVKRPDGGFGFYDGDGNEISAYDYANATGKKPSEVLTDSENPIDIGYLQDYRNLQDYMEAKFNSKGNTKSAAKAKQIEATIKKNFGVDVGKMNPSVLIDKFKQAYPTVYGGNKAGVPVGQTLIPRGDQDETDLAGGSSAIGG